MKQVCRILYALFLRWNECSCFSIHLIILKNPNRVDLNLSWCHESGARSYHSRMFPEHIFFTRLIRYVFESSIGILAAKRRIFDKILSAYKPNLNMSQNQTQSSSAAKFPLEQNWSTRNNWIENQRELYQINEHSGSVGGLVWLVLSGPKSSTRSYFPLGSSQVELGCLKSGNRK